MLRASDLCDAAASIFSWSMGVCFGRWNIENRGEDVLSSLTCELLFQSIPQVSFAMLKDNAGLSATSSPAGYPVHIEWDGILADDLENQHDAVRRVRDVLEFIWNDRAEGIEKEACEVFGVPELRDYFRKTGAGGFFGDHIRRYSKSRRKAPIYWLLQSSKKNYALWVYCHRLDKDLLFKALVNYVEPKIRLETSRLETLRSQKAVVGETGKEAKRLGKELERQEDFLSELRTSRTSYVVRQTCISILISMTASSSTSPCCMNSSLGKRPRPTGMNSSKESTNGPPSASNFARKDW